MDYFRRALQMLRLARSDEELARQSAVHPAYGMERASIAASRTDGGNFIFEPGNKLQEFRMLVGILSDASFKAPRGFDPTHRPVVTIAGRPAPNVGIYMTVVDKEVKARSNYKNFSILINACLGLQIVVAAAITALGAARGHNGAVVVFGAINTVIAGFLTYLKGSGLPNRLKYFQHEWDKVREYIEARERDLMVTDEAFDIYEQVEIIRQMYEEVKNDVESNTPDRFVSTGKRTLPDLGAARPGLSGRSSMMNGLGDDAAGKLSRIASSLNGNFGSVKKSAEGDIEKVGDLEKDVLSAGNRVSSRGHDTGVRFLESTFGLKSKVEDKIKDLSDLEKQIESHGRMILKHKEDEAAAKAQEVEKLRNDLAAQGTGVVHQGGDEIARLQREIEDRAKAIEELKAKELREVAEAAEEVSKAPHEL